MSATRRARLAALSLPLDSAARDAAEERELLRFHADACRLVRDAMLRAGADPGIAWALREFEAKVAGFADSPELQRADTALLAEEDEAEANLGAEEDPCEALVADLDRVAAGFADGSMPDFAQSSMAVLLAWAMRYGGG